MADNVPISQTLLVFLLIVAVLFSVVSMIISFNLSQSVRSGYSVARPYASVQGMPSGSPEGNVGLVVLTPPSGQGAP